jgi:hypothetical protein
LKVRKVVIDALSLLRIFTDYCAAEDIPKDAKLMKWMVKPSEQGKFAFVIESDSIKPDMPPIMVRFDIRRIFGVGV